MIAATLPEPTVLPPSRTFASEITVFSYDFQDIFGGFLFNIYLVSDVFGFFVIMVLSQSNCTHFLREHFNHIVKYTFRIAILLVRPLITGKHLLQQIRIPLLYFRIHFGVVLGHFGIILGGE